MKNRATEIRTILTEIGGSRLFYTAETQARVRLRLETAGPVSVSTASDIEPVLGGRGGLLNDVDMEFLLSRGDQLYYTAQAINRFRFVSEPVAVVQTVDVGSVEDPQPVNPPPPPKPQGPHIKMPRMPRQKIKRW